MNAHHVIMSFLGWRGIPDARNTKYLAIASYYNPPRHSMLSMLPEMSALNSSRKGLVLIWLLVLCSGMNSVGANSGGIYLYILQHVANLVNNHYNNYYS